MYIRHQSAFKLVWDSPSVNKTAQDGSKIWIMTQTSPTVEGKSGLEVNHRGKAKQKEKKKKED